MSITPTNKPICTIKSPTPEGGIQKAVIITPSKLQFINVDMTDDLVDLLIHEKIKDLLFEECSMPEEVAQLFVTTKESVLFKNCILTDPLNGDEIIGNLGFRRFGDEFYAYDPKLSEMGQKFSELPDETIKQLGAPSQMDSQSEEATNHQELLEAMTRAKSLGKKLETALAEIEEIIKFYTPLGYTNALEIPTKLKENIIAAQTKLTEVIDKYPHPTECRKIKFIRAIDAIKDADLALRDFNTYTRSDPD
jgi:hypothetical protein